MASFLPGSEVMRIEEQLRERLKKVEALYFGATTARNTQKQQYDRKQTPQRWKDQEQTQMGSRNCGSIGKARLRCQRQRIEVQYVGKLECIACSYLISARRSAVDEGRRRQAQAQRLLHRIVGDGARIAIGANRGVDAGASCRHLGAMLQTYLGPEQQPKCDNPEDE